MCFILGIEISSINAFEITISLLVRQVPTRALSKKFKFKQHFRGPFAVPGNLHFYVFSTTFPVWRYKVVFHEIEPNPFVQPWHLKTITDWGLRCVRRFHLAQPDFNWNLFGLPAAPYDFMRISYENKSQ